MKRIALFSWAATILASYAMALAQPGAAADGVVTPFITADTDVVVAADASAIDIDKLQAWVIGKIQASGIDQASQDQMVKATKEGDVTKAKTWLADFAKAGGKKMYVVASVAGAMSGAPGVMVVPVPAGGDAKAIARQLDPTFGGADPAPEGTPVAAVMGNNVIWGMKKSVDAAKTPAPAARADLAAALAATGNGTVRIAVSGVNLKGKELPGPAAVAGQIAQTIDWAALSVTVPPAEQATLTLQAKDADQANALAQMAVGALASLNTNEEAKKNFGDVKPIIAALTPKVAGNRITITLDNKTVENILLPAFIKAAAAETKGNAAPSEK